MIITNSKFISLKNNQLISNLGLNNNKKITTKNELEKLKKASKEFEILFVKQMMKSMRQASFESKLVKKSEGEKTFQSMLDENYVRNGILPSGLGLNKMIYENYKSFVYK